MNVATPTRHARVTLLRAALADLLPGPPAPYRVDARGPVDEALVTAALTLRESRCDEPIGRDGRLYLRRWHLTPREQVNGHRINCASTARNIRARPGVNRS